MYAIVWYIMPSFSIQNILVMETVIFPTLLANLLPFHSLGGMAV